MKFSYIYKIPYGLIPDMDTEVLKVITQNKETNSYFYCYLIRNIKDNTYKVSAQREIFDKIYDNKVIDLEDNTENFVIENENNFKLKVTNNLVKGLSKIVNIKVDISDAFDDSENEEYPNKAKYKKVLEEFLLPIKKIDKPIYDLLYLTLMFSFEKINLTITKIDYAKFLEVELLKVLSTNVAFYSKIEQVWAVKIYNILILKNLLVSNVQNLAHLLAVYKEYSKKYMLTIKEFVYLANLLKANNKIPVYVTDNLRKTFENKASFQKGKEPSKMYEELKKALVSFVQFNKVLVSINGADQNTFVLKEPIMRDEFIDILNKNEDFNFTFNNVNNEEKLLGMYISSTKIPFIFYKDGTNTFETQITMNKEFNIVQSNDLIYDISFEFDEGEINA